MTRVIEDMETERYIKERDKGTDTTRDENEKSRDTDREMERQGETKTEKRDTSELHEYKTIERKR